MITFNAVPAYAAAIPAMNLAEISIDDRTEPAPDAAINAPMRGWLTPPFATMASKYQQGAGGVGAAYDVAAMAPVVSPQAVPTGAFPK